MKTYILTMLLILVLQSIQLAGGFSSTNKCLLQSNGPHKMVHPCHNPWTVVTEVAILSMTCDDISKAVFFGKVTMFLDDCSFTFSSKPLCIELLDQDKYSLDCRTSLRWTTILFILVLVSVPIILLISIRFIWLKKRSLKRLDKLTMGKSVKVHLSKSSDNGIKNTTEKKMSWLLFILFFFGLHNPSWAREMEAILVGNGTSLSISDLSFNVRHAYINVPLVREFDTYPFSVVAEKETHCASSGCEDCRELGDRWINSQLEFQTGRGVIRKAYCKRGTPLSTCFFTQGCHKTIIELSTSEAHKMEMYSLGGMIPHVDVTVSNSSDCILNSILPRQLNLNKLMVARHRGEWMIYYTDWFYNKASAIKVDSFGHIVQSTNAFTCHSDESDGIDCEFNGVSTIKGGYLLPFRHGPADITIRDHVMRLDGKTLFEAEITCGKVLYKNDKQCGGLKFSLIGEDYSSSGVVLEVKTKDQYKGQSWSGLVPCVDTPVVINCDRAPSYFLVDRMSLCLKDLEYENKITVKKFDSYADHMIISKYTQYQAESHTESIGHFISNWWHGVSLVSGVSFVLVVMLIILLRR